MQISLKPKTASPSGATGNNHPAGSLKESNKSNVGAAAGGNPPTTGNKGGTIRPVYAIEPPEVEPQPPGAEPPPAKPVYAIEPPEVEPPGAEPLPQPPPSTEPLEPPPQFPKKPGQAVVDNGSSKE